VTTHLENLEKSLNWIVVRENGKSQGTVRESYNHHLAAAREKDITAFLRYQRRQKK